MNLKILVNAQFLAINTNPTLSPIDKKYVVSFANDFEDGKWRFAEFQNFIWDNIAETALSKRERESLTGHSHSMLTAAAKNLRLTDKEGDISRGSELAEIVLYGIMKNHFRALSVVPKIFYKQNSQDNAKGADSVHIVVSEDDFSIWFGEAKFYNNIEDERLISVIESVKNSLKTEKLKKENSIITNVSDIDELDISYEVREKIKEALSYKSSIDQIKSRINIPILILHECDITKGTTEFTEEYVKRIADHHKSKAQSYFEKQIARLKDIFKYEDITFHLILVPVACKKTVVEKFISNVQHYQG